MTRRALAAALGAMRQLSLAWLLWLLNAAFAAAIVPAAWAWWSRAADSPETDPLLERFRFGVFLELARADDWSGLAAIVTTALAVLAAGVAVGVFASGGVLQRLLYPAEDRAMAGFFRGGGRFWWRFLRLTIMTGVAASIAAVGASLPLLLVLPPDRALAGGGLVGAAAELLPAALVIAFFCAALDCARVRVAAGDERGMIRAWFGGLWCAVRHLLAVGALGVMVLGIWLILAWAYLSAARGLAGAATSAILLTVVAQQLFMFLRSALRVAWLAGLVSIVRSDVPPRVSTSISPAAPSTLYDTARAVSDAEEEGLPVV